MPSNKETAKQILKNSLLSISQDLIRAKENNQSLPPTLDKVANILFKAKNEGLNIAKEDVKQQIKMYLPYGIIAILLLYIIFKAK
jgi:hypothetical protein